MFDTATTDSVAALWFVVVAVSSIDVVAECVNVVPTLDVLHVVTESVEIGGEAGISVASTGWVDRGADRSTPGLSDSPLGASGEMYSGDGVVSNDVAAMTLAAPVAPNRAKASSHGPGRNVITRSSLSQVDTDSGRWC